MFAQQVRGQKNRKTWAVTRSTRRAYAQREAGRTFRDSAYTFYLICLTFVAFVLPLWFGFLSWLKDWWEANSVAVVEAVHTIPFLSAQALTLDGAVTCFLLLFWGGFLLLGRVRGPKVEEPFLSHTLAQSPLVSAAAIVLSGTALWSAALGLVMAFLFGSASFAASVAAPSAATVVLCAVAGVLSGCIAAILWGLSHLGGPVLRAVLSSAMLLGLVLVCFGAVPPFLSFGVTSGAYLVALLPLVILLALVAALLTLWVPRLNRRQFVVDAVRWRNASALLYLGDTEGSVEALRTSPLFRRPDAIRGSWFPAVIVVRDAVALLRYPARLLAALIVSLLAGFLSSMALGSGAGSVSLLLFASALWFFASGLLCDGFRYAVAAVEGPAFYGGSRTVLLFSHAFLPLMVPVLIGTACGVLAGQPLLTATVALVVSSARIADAAKGAIPAKLLTPIPTPFGDGSSVLVLLWNFGGFLLAVFAATGIAFVFGTGGSLWLLCAALWIGLMGVLCWVRFR